MVMCMSTEDFVQLAGWFVSNFDPGVTQIQSQIELSRRTNCIL